MGALLFASVYAVEDSLVEKTHEVIAPTLPHTTSLPGRTPFSSNTEIASTFEDAPSDKLEATPATIPFVQSERDLSALGIIALGVVGLIWIRRHSSER